MRLVYVEGVTIELPKIKKVTLSERALRLAGILHSNHRRQALKTFKTTAK